MIGKGRLFDLISRTADDVNNPELTIMNVLQNYSTREEKYYRQTKDIERED